MWSAEARLVRTNNSEGAMKTVDVGGTVTNQLSVGFHYRIIGWGIDLLLLGQ